MTDYTWPDDLAPYAVSFYLQAHSGGSESPFTRQSKIYGLSAPRWVCSMSFRGGYNGAAGLTSVGPRMDAMVAKLAGRANRALLYDFRRPAMRTPGFPISPGNFAALMGATTITITDLPPGLTVLAGDYIGGDGRPHIILDDVVADLSGQAVVSIAPPLAAPIAEGGAVFGKPIGAFRLTSDDAGDNGVQVGDAVSMTLTFVEDIGSDLPVDLPPPPLGIFFDSGRGDTFTGPKISVPVDASLTTSASQIVFTHTGSNLSLYAQIKDRLGNVIKSAFDAVTVEFTATVRPFDIAGAGGVTGGYTPNDNVGVVFGGSLRSHGGSASLAMTHNVLNGNALANDGGVGPSLTGGIPVTVKAAFLGSAATVTVTYPGLSPVGIPLTMVLAATSYQIPVLFNQLGLQFVRADMTITSLKVSAGYTNARFAFIGDSITDGFKATDHEHGFASLIRADYTNVLIAGAPSAQTSDWKTAAHMTAFCDMAPQYAFVMLGTNDFALGRTLSAIETDYTSIMNTLIAAGITPIALAVLPKTDVNIPTFNTWLADPARPWTHFVDTYTPLLGTGTSMNATYDSGDGIHPNDAGHALLHTTIHNYIIAQGL